MDPMGLFELDTFVLAQASRKAKKGRSKAKKEELRQAGHLKFPKPTKGILQEVAEIMEIQVIMMRLVVQKSGEKTS